MEKIKNKKVFIGLGLAIVFLIIINPIVLPKIINRFSQISHTEYKNIVLKQCMEDEMKSFNSSLEVYCKQGPGAVWSNYKCSYFMDLQKVEQMARRHEDNLDICISDWNK